MVSTRVDNTTLMHRFSDIAAELHTMLMPIEGYEKMRLVSLDEAVEPLVPFVRDVQRRAWIVKQRCENPSDNLSSDESAAIALYTLEWEPSNDSLHFILNSILRNENRTKLKPWFLYLKLLLTALSHLPSIGDRNIYRGIKLDVSQMYPQDKIFIWWGFSSCTTSLKVLEDEEFLGLTGPRTLFAIECPSGKNIQRHSYIPNDHEVLVLPATQFKVISCLDQGYDFHVIQLKEVEPLHSLLEPVSDYCMPYFESSMARSSKKLLRNTLMPLLKTRMRSNSHNTHQNFKLEKRITKCESRSLIDLDRQSLTDQDMPIIVQQAVINKQCTRLRLSDNKITFVGITILAEALYNNTVLEGLYIFNNHIADEGIYSLTQLLAKNKSALKTLSLGWNNITDQGATYLAEMLKTNRTLIELWLPWNQISDRGVKLLTDVLIHHNTTLKRLSLDLNKFVTDSSVDYLVDMMNLNESLTALHVRECKISKLGKAKLQEMKKSKKNIELNL